MKLTPDHTLAEWERFAAEAGIPYVATRDKVTVGDPGRASVAYDAVVSQQVRLYAWDPKREWSFVEMTAADARRLAAELMFAADRVDNGGQDAKQEHS